MGGILKRITSFPFMERLFLLLFSVMAKNMFGEKNGFQQRFYPSPRGTVKFDILDCVYCRYCRKCGCPELIHTFCNTDAYCFGNLSKIRFVREDTLENGEKCDFTLRSNIPLSSREVFHVKASRLFLYLAASSTKKISQLHLNSTFVVYHKGVPGRRGHHRSGKRPEKNYVRRYISEPTGFTQRK